MALHDQLETPLALAVRTAGSQAAFARLIGKGQPTVNDWLKLNKPLPLEHVPRVEDEYGIPRHELRPDYFDPPARRTAEQPSAPASCPNEDGVDGSDPLKGLAA